jgi:FAD/FMN-containing dehydrogenase
VAAAVRYARTAGLEIAVCAGAHSIPGLCTCDDGLVVNLRRMNQVSVDPEARRVQVQGGTLIGQLDAATQAYGLAVPMGLVSHTGVAGLTLGGGMGWLTRIGGLSIDNLLSAEVVVADGRILRASADENTDLFWAIRGGGGNFGVVTSFEFRLIEAGPIVQFGFFFWPQEQGRDALRLMRQVAADLPPSLNGMPAVLNAPPAPFVPAEVQGRQGYAFLLIGFGDEAEHQEVAARIRAALPPLVDAVGPMPYLALQQMLDEANAWGFYSYDKSGYFADLTDGLIDAVVDQVPRKTSPMSVLLFYRLDEAFSRVGEDDTAFGGGRSPRYAGLFIGVTPTPDLLPAERDWIRGLWAATQPHMISAGSYVNAIEGQDPAEVEATYGVKYRRLAAVKAAYDPDNVFHRNVNIAARAAG